MHWTLSGFNTCKNLDRDRTFMLWWASASLRLGDVEFLRFGGRGRGEEGGGAALSYVHLFIGSPIFSLRALTNSLFLFTSDSQVWLYAIQTQTQACTHCYLYASSFTEELRQMNDSFSRFADVSSSLNLKWKRINLVIITGNVVVFSMIITPSYTK